MPIAPSQVLKKIVANSGQAENYYSAQPSIAGMRVDPAWNDDAKAQAIESGAFGPEIQQYWLSAQNGGLDSRPGTTDGSSDVPGMNLGTQQGTWLAELLARPNQNDALAFASGANADPNAQRAGGMNFMDRYVQPVAAAGLAALGGVAGANVLGFGGVPSIASAAPVAAETIPGAFAAGAEGAAAGAAGAGGAGAAGAATPWLSNAPAGSVFAGPAAGAGDAAFLGAAGITPTYTPASAALTTAGGEAFAAGATPWLSNAPAGSVFAADAAAPFANAVKAMGSANSLIPSLGTAKDVATTAASAKSLTNKGNTTVVTTGDSTVDAIMKQLKDNALALGLIGGGTMLAAGQQTPMPNQAQLQSLGSDAQKVAQQLIQQYQTQTLSPGQQASLDQLAGNTKNQLRQYFASIGQSDSTAAVQALAQVDQSTLGMKQEMLDSALSQGLSAIGIAQGPLNTIAQYQLGQDAQLRQAFGNFASAASTLFGRTAGAKQDGQQQRDGTGTTKAATITSAVTDLVKDAQEDFA